MNKSPFLILENLLTKEACNDIITSLKLSVPNYINDQIVMTLMYNKLEELRLQPLVDDFLDYSEEYYNIEIKKISKFNFEWYPEGYKTQHVKSDSNEFLNGKWIKNSDIDFTFLLFLTDEIINTNITDIKTEHLGGGLQFPTHKFTIHPKAGDAIMFPSNKNFLFNYSNVDIGNMVLVHLMIETTVPYVYNRKDYEGNYKTWFSNIGE